MTAPRAIVGMYSFTTTDPSRLSTFWGELMQLPRVEAGPDLVMPDVGHEVAPLGAERVSEHDEQGARWIVMRDPDGNQFRIFGPRPGVRRHR